MTLWQIFLLACGGGLILTAIIYKLKKIYYERKLLKRCVKAVKQIIREEYFKELNELNEKINNEKEIEK